MVREALTSEMLRALEPRDAAARFIARRAEGLSASEEELLTEWLASDEAHRRVFDSADRAWQSFAESQGDEILDAMRAHALTPRRQARAIWRPVAAAAAVLLAVGAALYVAPGWNPWAPESRPGGSVSVAAIEYTSARGEVRELQLPDGSSMSLDADSTAVGRFSSNSRNVQLQRGRAYFAVMPDRSRPFVVTTARRSIVAVGTRFDVNLIADVLTVTLLEGTVQIRSADPTGAPVTLAPGQQYVERLGKATIRTIGATSENAITWRMGLVNFDDQPLAEAAAVMNRYSGDQIVISDPAVASLRVSGQFRASDPERFAATLGELYQLQAVRRANQIELVRRK